MRLEDKVVRFVKEVVRTGGEVRRLYAVER